MDNAVTLDICCLVNRVLATMLSGFSSLVPERLS